MLYIVMLSVIMLSVVAPCKLLMAALIYILTKAAITINLALK